MRRKDRPAVQALSNDNPSLLRRCFLPQFCRMDFPLRLRSYRIGEEDIHLFVPDAQTVKEAYHQSKIAFPYWSKVWPAAIALSEFIVQQPHLVQNKIVLEAGAGLGLPSLVAARFASNVLCTDASAEAVQIAAQSAAHHRLQNFSSVVLNWNCLPDTGIVCLIR